MNLDTICNQIYVVAVNEAKLQKHEYVTPEHFLYAALMFDTGKEIIENSGGDVDKIIQELQYFLSQNITTAENEKPIESFSFIEMFEVAASYVINCEKEVITLGNLIVAIFSLKESYGAYVLLKNNVDKLSVMRYISHELNITSNEEKEETLSKEEAFLAKFAFNLTEKAKNNELDPIVVRDDIMTRTIQVLCRRIKNNPVHVGFPGVGKTSVVECLAQMIANKDVPEKLENADVFYVDMGSIVAGTKYRGDFEERLIKIIDIISEYDNPIIYLDEIHNIVGTGSTSGSAMDATSILKPYLSKGIIKFIGSTTYDEYKKYIEKDRALSRRFQKIDVDEPSISESIEILMGIKDEYEKYHNVVYSEEIIKLSCELSSKYLNDRYMPDKAIDVIDETGAYVRMNLKNDSKITITKKDIERTISSMAKVPTESISKDDKINLKNLESILKKEVFGQDKAIEDVVTAIKLSRSGLKDINKPVASLLFVGPTGVGKTEIAKQVADKLSINLLRYDMSEYQEKHSVSRLIGSPPGYVGFEEGGLLTEEIKRNPHSVLLLDEIEKAHSDILNVLLQVMDYGILTDNTGKKADFKNVIIIMTSNAGAREIGKRIIGFDNKVFDSHEIDKEVEKVFSPEFRNRLDGIIVFNHIDEQMAVKITKKALKELSNKLAEKGITLKTTNKLINYISSKGLSEKYGAREILRVVNNDIKKLLVEEVLFGKVSGGGEIALEFKNDKVHIKTKSL